MQDYVQQRIVKLDVSVLVDDPMFARIAMMKALHRREPQVFWHVDAARGATASSPKSRPPAPARGLLVRRRRRDPPKDEACLDDAPRAAPRADEPGGFPRFAMIHTVLEDFSPCRHSSKCGRP
jgi:hypothetical protein